MFNSDKLKDIRIKAGNPDDEVEIARLIRLFTSTYGHSFPAKEVYNTQFWNKHIGSRFSSLLVTFGNQIIGHLAVQPDRDMKKNIQLAFPAIDPKFVKFAAELAGAAWQVIQKQRDRQGWRSLYMLTMAEDEMMQQIACDVFGADVVAICPGYFPGGQASTSVNGKAGKRRCDAIINQRVFHQALPEDLKRCPLYVPERHRAVCRYLFSGIGLSRPLYSEQSSTEENLHLIPADARAVEKLYFHRPGINQMFIYPSLLENFSTIEGILSSHVNTPSFLYVSMRDSRCPEFCTFLEERGCSFSGVLPLLHNRESIVFHKSDDWLPNIECFYSERSKSLARYIVENKQSETLPPSEVLLNQLLNHPEDLRH